MKDRGMMKWLPYKSLVEQAKINRAMNERLEREEKPLISEEKAEEINEYLLQYSGQISKITYFRLDHRRTLVGYIQKIRPEERYLVAEGIRIPFHDLLDIEDA